MQLYSTPPLDEFVPLPGQLDVIRHIRKADYETKGTQEILLSGSVGSAKSLTLAHMAITHSIMYPGAQCGIGRLALPQLKATLCPKIKQHLHETGIDYQYSEVTGDFKLPNDSKLKAITWADGNYEKLGSYELSAMVIEELIESKNGKAYEIILERVNRIPHINEPFVLSATNPDAPSHWAHKKIVMSKSDNVKVFYSNTFDNPYLPKTYIANLLDRLSPKEAQRKVYGKWVELDSEVIYYSYSNENYRHYEYEIQRSYPICLCFDFNIGDGKPLSMAVAQYVDSRDEWHVFDEVIVDGQRTRDCMEEAAERGLFENPNNFIIHGDRNGKNRDTRGVDSDYDIIENFLANYQRKDGSRIRFQNEVPRSNPSIRERHNEMNAYFKSASGKTRMWIYKGAETCDEGFRLTKLKSGGQYLEDDRDRWQHVTTAIGYAVMEQREMNKRGHDPGPTTIGTY